MRLLSVLHPESGNQLSDATATLAFCRIEPQRKDTIKTQNLAARNRECVKMGLEHFARQCFDPAILGPQNGPCPSKIDMVMFFFCDCKKAPCTIRSFKLGHLFMTFSCMDAKNFHLPRSLFFSLCIKLCHYLRLGRLPGNTPCNQISAL